MGEGKIDDHPHHPNPVPRNTQWGEGWRSGYLATMTVRTILHYPDERLKRVAIPVTQFDNVLKDFVADLLDTLNAAPGCVGLAAPQVNYFQRIVVVDVSQRKGVTHHGRLILINPEILDTQGSTVGREGCLSVPDSSFP